ncbi:MAG: hypothetical protein Q6K99_08375 [Thermostichales cyanobacterium BF4_bins_65]
MTESATPRSHRREHVHAKADALLDDLFEDLDSSLRTTPMPGSRLPRGIYPQGYVELDRGWGWGPWLVGAGAIGLLLVGWWVWRSYTGLVAQVIEPVEVPVVALPEPEPQVLPEPEPTPQAKQEPAKPAPPVASPVVAAAPSRVARPVVRAAAPAPVAYTEPEVIRYVAPPPQQVQTTTYQQPLPMKLVGTVSGPGTPMALILIDDVVREVPVGQTVLGSWRVQSVSRDGVMLSDGRRGVAMHLGLGQGH